MTVSRAGAVSGNSKGFLSVEEWFRRGKAAAGQNRLEEAASCYRKALKLQPVHSDAWNNLGLICLAQNKLTEAIASFRQVIALKPDYAEAHFNLAVAFYDQGKLDDAVASIRQVLILKPHSAVAHFNLGNFLMAQGKLEEAIVGFRQALDEKPDYAEALCNLGVIYNELGRKESAIASLRKALSLKPDNVLAFKGLSRIMKFSEDDDVLRKMENLYSEGKLSRAERKDLGFALGNVFGDLKEYDKSFNYFLKANRLKRKSYEYSIQNDCNFFERIKEVFSADFFASHHGSGHQDRSPIFILGMPRSGTTLVEQILASHPLVFGAGELAILGHITSSICTGREIAQFPECMLHLGMDALARIGSDYLEKIRRQANDAEYITDKMPHNFLRVGLIKAILPHAKVIHCIRNPMDNCLSIFKMDFTGPHGYAYDLVEIGQYYNLYRALMAHWEEVLPGFMYPLEYEKMVVDPERQTRNLLDFCGLPWDEACLHFYETERRVVTASLVQVRRPIYRDSIEVWRRHASQLEPLRKIIHR
ncbi:MAG: sulfotransferase [Deltaproteobacteria bacterium]